MTPIDGNKVFNVDQIKNQENKIKVDSVDLFTALFNKSDKSSDTYTKIGQLRDDVLKMVEGFNKDIDGKILVSRDDKGQTLEGSKIVPEEDFDKQVQGLSKKLNDRIVQAQKEGVLNTQKLGNDLSNILNVDSFVNSLKSASYIQQKAMTVGAGDYLKAPNPLAGNENQKSDTSTASLGKLREYGGDTVRERTEKALNDAGVGL